jgi:amino acid transporter
VKEPEKTIPRAIIYSILLVAAIYIVMNISILGVIPWREFSAVAETDAQKYVVSAMMERLYGPTAGVIATVLIIFTAFASVFSLLLGYSRVPYAAALDGNYFKIFSKLHPVHPLSIHFAFGDGRYSGGFLFLSTCRCYRRNGRDTHTRAVYRSDRRIDDPQKDTS